MRYHRPVFTRAKIFVPKNYQSPPATKNGSQSGDLHQSNWTSTKERIALKPLKKIGVYYSYYVKRAS